MSSGITVEHHMRIYDDKHGWYVVVRPDSDTGDLCEIAWNDGGPGDKDGPAITIPWTMARVMAEAIINTMPIAKDSA